MKRTPLKRTTLLKNGGVGLKRSALKKRSLKQAKEDKAFYALKNILITGCCGEDCKYYSELSGKLVAQTWFEGGMYVDLDPHHLAGRDKNYYNPFTIIMCSRKEHDYETDHHTWERDHELMAKIRTKRLAQGFKVKDYE